jgi:DNA replication protein DnaC
MMSHCSDITALTRCKCDIHEFAAECGLSEDELRRVLWRLNTSPADIRNLAERLGKALPTMLQAMLAKASRRDAENEERAGQFIFRKGPQALARLDDDSLAKCIKSPFLRKWSETYQVNQGSKLILGPTDLGKTSAVIRAVKRIAVTDLRTRRAEALAQLAEIENGLSIVWARALDLSMARSRHKLGEGEAAELLEARDADLLVVDDLGWEDKSEAIAWLLACRYDVDRPTLVTSGYTIGHLEQRYGPAIIRRIVTSGGLPTQILDLFKKGAADRKP